MSTNKARSHRVTLSPAEQFPRMLYKLPINLTSLRMTAASDSATVTRSKTVIGSDLQAHSHEKESYQFIVSSLNQYYVLSNLHLNSLSPSMSLSQLWSSKFSEANTRLTSPRRVSKWL